MRSTFRFGALVRIATICLVAFFGAAGCGDEHDHQHDDAECSGHGHLDGDQCHCDEGYETDSEDETKCVAHDDDHDGHQH